MDKGIVFDMPPKFRPYAESAICRLRYLHPTHEFSTDGSTIDVQGHDVNYETLRRDVFHALYREKLAEQSVVAKIRLINELTAR